MTMIIMFSDNDNDDHNRILIMLFDDNDNNDHDDDNVNVSAEDPCSGVDCGQAGLCLVTGDTQTCSCLPGDIIRDSNGIFELT